MREKAIFICNGIWDDLPTVKLKNMLEKERWCKTAKITIDTDQKQWESRSCTTWVPDIELNIPYRGSNVSVRVGWNSPSSYRQHTSTKSHFKIFPPYEAMIRSSTSGTYEGAMQRVLEAVEKTLPEVDKHVEKREKEKKLQKMIDEKIQKVKAELAPMDFQSEAYNSHELNYKPAPSFCLKLDFHINSEEELEISISGIYGKYTTEEIREIAKIVGTNPRAVAERMLKN